MEQILLTGSNKLMDFGILGIFSGLACAALIYLIWHILKRADKVLDRWDESLMHERAEHADCRKSLHEKMDRMETKIDGIQMQIGGLKHG